MKTLSLSAALGCVLAWLPSFNASCQQYTFTTIAGLPRTIGSQDGTNSQARFNFPAGITVDSRGVVYVCDLLNHRIRQVRPEGTNWVVRTLAGGAFGFADGTNGQAQFDHPTGIAVDSDGNVFVGDKYNNVIRKLTPIGTDWVVTTIAGDPTIQASNDGVNSSAHFSGPAGVAIDSSNRLYVADATGNTIRQIVANGADWVVTTVAGFADIYGDFVDGTNDAAMFNAPYAMAVDAAGVLYVADYGNHAVRRIEQIGFDWATTTIAGTNSPGINSAGMGIPGTNDGPGFQAMFDNPSGVAVGGGGVVFVADYDNHTIRAVTPGGKNWTVSTLAGVPKISGTNDGSGIQARFNKPRDIAVTRDGVLFISDYSNQTIRMGVPLPALQIILVGNQVVLSWPLWANNYVLETSPNLAPAPVWTPVTDGIATAGSSFVLTNTIASTSFFRLRQQ